MNGNPSPPRRLPSTDRSIEEQSRESTHDELKDQPSRWPGKRDATRLGEVKLEIGRALSIRDKVLIGGKLCLSRNNGAGDKDEDEEDEDGARLEHRQQNRIESNRCDVTINNGWQTHGTKSASVPVACR